MAAPWEQGAGWCGGEASLHGVMLCFLERLASQQSPPSILLRYEERFVHPAQNAAAAGRLHCLTTTRAGFSPRILRLL